MFSLLKCDIAADTSSTTASVSTVQYWTTMSERTVSGPHVSAASIPKETSWQIIRPPGSIIIAIAFKN